MNSLFLGHLKWSYSLFSVCMWKRREHPWGAHSKCGHHNWPVAYYSQKWILCHGVTPTPLPWSHYEFSLSVMSHSLRPHEPQHTRPPCHHQLPEFTQTHVHWCHLILCRPLLLLLSVFPSIRVFWNEPLWLLIFWLRPLGKLLWILFNYFCTLFSRSSPEFSSVNTSWSAASPLVKSFC